MPKPLQERIDFYYNKHGYMVFTEHFLLERGYCCGNGCKHCPYEYEKVPEPRRSTLLANRQGGNEEEQDK